MIKFQDLLTLKRASFFLLSMPFFFDFAYTCFNTDNPPFTKLFILFLIIALCDYIFHLIFIKTRKWYMFFALTYAFLLVFFYYRYIILLFVTINDLTLNLHYRERYILIIVFVIITLVLIRYKEKIINALYIFNIFLIIFSVIGIIYKIDFKPTNKETITSHLLSFDPNEGKPIILIIADEYASPRQLMRNFNDSSIFNFQKKLLASKWKTKENFYSKNILTINSLASIFNFNFQTADQYLSIPYSRKSLRKSSLYDSLEKKKILFYNYGIFDIGKSIAMTKIAFYEDETQTNNFTQGIFRNTIISPLLYPNLINKHNRLNIDYAVNRLNTIANNSFVYIHLLIPHGPYAYEGKKCSYTNLDNKDNLESYYDYWKFSNKLLTSFLSDLSKDNRYRIILTGDHGFRSDKRVNPHYTFTAFYGFEQASVDNIKSVQDLGSFIYYGY